MLAWLALSAVSIAANWLIYIWAVQNARIFEASLGYYINPLIFVLVGVMFFGERLGKLQIWAAILAAIGVGLQTLFGPLRKHLPAAVRGPLHLEARRAAGFSESELGRLQGLAGSS